MTSNELANEDYILGKYSLHFSGDVIAGYARRQRENVISILTERAARQRVQELLAGEEALLYDPEIRNNLLMLNV